MSWYPLLDGLLTLGVQLFFLYRGWRLNGGYTWIWVVSLVSWRLNVDRRLTSVAPHPADVREIKVVAQD